LANIFPYIEILVNFCLGIFFLKKINSKKIIFYQKKIIGDELSDFFGEFPLFWKKENYFEKTWKINSIFQKRIRHFLRNREFSF
jgi:hypothetical protein